GQSGFNRPPGPPQEALPALTVQATSDGFPGPTSARGPRAGSGIGKGAGRVVQSREHELMRQQMVAEVVADAVFLTPQIGKSSFDSRVIEVMGRIPRHEFVPVELQAYSYINSPLPVGYGKTVSQPFIIALMTDLLDPQPGDTVLEIGAGVGYQAAILSELVKQVFSIDIIEELALETRSGLDRLGYRSI